jgi:hypothetical protein
MFLDGNRIELSDLAEDKLKTPNVLIRITRFQKRFRKDGLNGMELAH